MRQVGQVIRLMIELLAPAGLIVAFEYASRTGWFTLFAFGRGYAAEYGNYALLLGVAAALVASATFNRDEKHFGLSAFLGTAFVGLLTISPFVLGRAGIRFDIPPKVFDLITIFAYLGFFITIGIILGGCWSVLVKAVRGIVFRVDDDDWSKPVGVKRKK
jgi:hypothetical protein